MKVLYWNVRGMGCRLKRATVKEVILNSKANLVLLQESKLRSMSDLIV